jgi:hypothetical protein
MIPQKTLCTNVRLATTRSTMVCFWLGTRLRTGLLRIPGARIGAWTVSHTSAGTEPTTKTASFTHGSLCSKQNAQSPTASNARSRTVAESANKVTTCCLMALSTRANSASTLTAKPATPRPKTRLWKGDARCAKKVSLCKRRPKSAKAPSR